MSVYWRMSQTKDIDYPRGMAGYSDDGGITWYPQADRDFLFEEWGVTVTHHHPTIPNEPTVARMLAGMGSPKIQRVKVVGYKVATGEEDSTAYNNKRSLARKSNGDLCCAYSRGGRIYYGYSTNDGKSWTEEQVTSEEEAAWGMYPSIAVDSVDNVHVVWEGNNLGGEYPDYDHNIQYRKRTSEGWQNQEAITDDPNGQFSPAIAIDSNDNVHTVWEGFGWGENPDSFNIQYRKRTGAGWQDQEPVTDIGGWQDCAAIAIDSAGNVHLSWFGLSWGENPDSLNIQYRKRTNEGWQDREAVTDVADWQIFPTIAVDSADIAHIIWTGKGWGDNPDYYNIQYQKRASEGWRDQDREPVTDIAYNQTFESGDGSCFGGPSMSIDSDDNIHVVWPGFGWGQYPDNLNIRYRRKTTSWQSQVGITDIAYYNSHPILIWALYPVIGGLRTNRPKAGYALVWSGQDEYGYKVEYFASKDLGWETA